MNIVKSKIKVKTTFRAPKNEMQTLDFIDSGSYVGGNIASVFELRYIKIILSFMVVHIKCTGVTFSTSTNVGGNIGCR